MPNENELAGYDYQCSMCFRLYQNQICYSTINSGGRTYASLTCPNCSNVNYELIHIKPLYRHTRKKKFMHPH